MTRGSNGHYTNGRNGQSKLHFTTQTLIEKVVEQRVDAEDSNWQPNQSPDTIRNQLFKEVLDGVASQQHGPPQNGFHRQNGTENGQIETVDNCRDNRTTTSWLCNPFRSSVRTQSREDIRFNGHSDAPQHVPNPNMANGWDPAHTWNNRRFSSTSLQLIQMFGSQNMYGGTVQCGDISLSRIRSQNSPINLSVQTRNDDRSDENSSTDREPQNLGVQSRRTNVRQISEESSSSEGGQSHWKKKMVTNSQQEQENQQNKK
ncbi:uncharacterized protein LOC111696470 [Eurytemora carolleeae]|uniref:uncharacterized protein LOC111696470 n=1 Tax=Eurytemora carolleeae TaxID=1294199 RepID=UPI000C792D3B|nr:uncharacterized protein LOC111696470 [Eurytemora carolleeae]|eukprot:XP_023321845.1 uncharacterized protein LOC111696470 [Eurytemora affinis]